VADPGKLDSGVKFQIDYTQLKTAADNMDDLRNNLDSQLSAWKAGITDSSMEGTTIYGGTFTGSGNGRLDQSLYDFYNRFTDIASDAKTKLEKLSQTFRTVALQYLDNDLGLASSINYQSYQYLLSAWAGKEAAWKHYQATKNEETTFQTYDENGNLVTQHIPMWAPGSPTPADPGAAPTSYNNLNDVVNPLFGFSDKTISATDVQAYGSHAASMTTTVHLDQGVLDTNTGPNPPDSDHQQSPVTQSDTTVSYDGGTYTESTTHDVTNKFAYTSHITHADGTTETAACTSNPDGSNAVWTDVTKHTDGTTDNYKWTGNANSPGDRVLVDSPSMHPPKNSGGGGRGGQGANGHLGLI
jgi:hypothetical protein